MKNDRLLSFFKSFHISKFQKQCLLINLKKMVLSIREVLLIWVELINKELVTKSEEKEAIPRISSSKSTSK